MTSFSLPIKRNLTRTPFKKAKVEENPQMSHKEKNLFYTVSAAFYLNKFRYQLAVLNLNDKY